MPAVGPAERAEQHSARDRREEMRLYLAASAVLAFMMGLCLVTYCVIAGVLKGTEVGLAFLPFFLVGIVLLLAGAFLTRADIRALGDAGMLGKRP